MMREHMEECAAGMRRVVVVKAAKVKCVKVQTKKSSLPSEIN